MSTVSTNAPYWVHREHWASCWRLVSPPLAWAVLLIPSRPALWGTTRAAADNEGRVVVLPMEVMSSTAAGCGVATGVQLFMKI